LVKTVVIGAINWDVNLFIEIFPKKGEEVVVRRITRVPGGKAGNVAVAAARLLGPNQAAILGGLGKDQVASDQARILKDEGVDASGLKFSDGVESGQAYITIDGKGENIIHTYPGANATITPEDIDAPVRRKLISESSVITIMDPPFETALKLASEAKRLNKIVAWDPGVKSELGLEKAAKLLKNVDYVVANESETEHLAGTTNHETAARKLQELNEDLNFIAKLGSKGSILYHRKNRVTANALNLDAHGLKVVNTVGCGDAFIGAFVAAISEGMSDLEALKWANCAGGLKATKIETRGSPSREILQKYLA
jgi:ribokinase